MARLSVQSIDQFIGQGNPIAQAGGARMLLRATGGNLAGAAFLAALARKESSFGTTSGRFRNNAWGWGVHLGPEVNTSSSWEEGARKVWKGLNSGLYKGAGLNTASQIIQKYAPPSENNTQLYKQQVGQWFNQLGLPANANIFQSSAPGVANAVPPAAGAPGAADIQPVSGSLDVQRLMAILNAQRQRVLSGQMPAPGYQRELSKLVAGALQGAQVKTAGQQVGAQVSGAAQAALTGVPGGLTMGGGPDAHHSRALGNWQSDDAYDLMGRAGQQIYSPIGGTVVKISGQPGGNPQFAGYGITVRTPQGDLFFKHLGTSNVKPGQKIKPGQLIGTLDSHTGGGPHLHLGGTNRALLDQLAKLYTRR